MHVNTNMVLNVYRRNKRGLKVCFVCNSRDEMSLRCVKLSTRACL